MPVSWQAGLSLLTVEFVLLNSLLFWFGSKATRADLDVGLIWSTLGSLGLIVNLKGDDQRGGVLWTCNAFQLLDIALHLILDLNVCLMCRRTSRSALSRCGTAFADIP